MKYFYRILTLSAILSLTACDLIPSGSCKNTCPQGQKQKEDCSCYTPEKAPAGELQQKEITLAIANNNEQALMKLLDTIALDSTFSLDSEAVRKIYANNSDMYTRLTEDNNNLNLLFLLAPLDNFNQTFYNLLQKGISPNTQTTSGITPLDVAISANQGEKVKMLLDAGANVNFDGEDNILTSTLKQRKYKALNALASFAREKEVTFRFHPDYFIKAMINNNAELANAVAPLTEKETLNTPNYFGILPLVQAATNANLKLLDTLIASGANLELKNENLRTPLLSYLQETYIAQIEGNLQKGHDSQVVEVVKHFLDGGANINAKDDHKENIMFYAVRINNRPLIDLLVKSYKQDINTRNDIGETPLFTAAQNVPTLVPYLLTKGANPKVMDNSGRTPAIAAVEVGNMDTYDLLENAIART